MGNKGVRGDENMGAGDENRKKKLGKTLKKRSQLVLIVIGQNRKPRQRLALTAVKRGRNSPNASPTKLHLLELARRVFNEAVRRIGDDGMNGVPLGLLQPIEGVDVKDFVGRIIGEQPRAGRVSSYFLVPPQGDASWL